MKNDWLVTLILFIPILGLVPILVLPKAREQQIKWAALITTIVAFGASLLLLFSFDTTIA